MKFTLLLLFSFIWTLFGDSKFLVFAETCYDYICQINYCLDKFDSEEVISETDIRVKNADSLYVSNDNTVYLLDSYQKCIFKMKNMQTDVILLNECALPCDFYLYNDYIYVFDEILNELFIYNLDGTFFTRFEINIENDYFRKFIKINNILCILTFSDNLYSIDLNDRIIILHGQLPHQDVYNGFDFSEYVGQDNQGNEYYIQTDINDESSILSGKIFITQKNIKTNKFFKYEYPLDLTSSLPLKYVFIKDDGEVVLLLSAKEVVVIAELDNFYKKVELLRNELEELSKENYKLKKKSTKTLEKEYNSNGGSKFGLVSYNRNKVFDKVNEIVNYKWTLTNDNVEFSSELLRLPREFEYIVSTKSQNVDWEVEVIGIPYCWGGFSSIYTNKKNSYNFNYTIEEKDYLAGNICTQGSYKGSTAGLDCSGYVSLVYGLSEKYSTRTLLNISKPINNFKDLECMDMLVSPGSHVMLFCDFFDDDSLLVSEVAAREGKSINQVRSLNWFIANSTYQMRTAWK